ncbi:uncharacterized protein LOC129601527 isoform X3 [Paramacrobiotus metropolitanus]|uniref:uncharacterized protein LOC129601527 isoform X3 n=1 Tax=Paramacrobiotus metropolitanus TaxID=2943436 RepID=UPI002445F32D|nr:uncharacterized protein LOC129601527 isoform X3 [Paramacrobiotus metropolitanus]
MDGKKTNVKKGKDEKTNKIRELSLVEEALRIDWTHSVPQCSLTQLDEWYNGAIDAIARDDDVENFKNALKAVHPPIALVSLFQHNRDNFAVCDIIKLAVIRGCRQIVELIIKILGEQKFYEFAQWGKYNCSHIAAIWGHADLIEIFQEYFVKQGGDPSMVPADGSVLLHIWIRLDHRLIQFAQKRIWLDTAQDVKKNLSTSNSLVHILPVSAYCSPHSAFWPAFRFRAMTINQPVAAP